MAEAGDGITALASIADFRPDVAVLDISMPGINGLELTRRVAEEYPAVRVIIMTVHEDRAYVQPLLKSGALGSFLKRSAAEDLVRAVHAVAEGGVYLDPAIAGVAMGHSPASGRAVAAVEAELSPRETDVLRFTAQGYFNQEIAARLEISVKSVETYKARAAEKLGLRVITQARCASFNSQCRGTAPERCRSF